MQIIEHNSW